MADSKVKVEVLNLLQKDKERIEHMLFTVVDSIHDEHDYTWDNLDVEVKQWYMYDYKHS